jgi:hypothetical protein
MATLKRTFAVSCLSAILLWNVLFGVFGEGLLCLHLDLSAHLEKSETSLQHCDGSAAVGVAFGASADDCPPCIDVELRGEVLDFSRFDEFEAPAPDPFAAWQRLPIPALEPASLTSVRSTYFGRAPPSAAETPARQIARTIVLRV